MNFTLHLPNDYQRHPLPGRDEWCADLRANPDKQMRQVLGWPEGPNCSLGRYVRLQERLTVSGCDGPGRWKENDKIYDDNPAFGILGECGIFPTYVRVELENDPSPRYNLGQCNDAGLTFAQIATIIENVWYNSGPILK